jgi:hypothetical protein
VARRHRSERQPTERLVARGGAVTRRQRTGESDPARPNPRRCGSRIVAPMTPASTTTELPQPRTAQNRLSRWTRQRRLRRDLARRDRAAAQLAELHQIRTFITAAHALVRGGWVQHGWFAHRTQRGELRATTGWNAYRNNGRPVAGACLGPARTERRSDGLGSGGPGPRRDRRPRSWWIRDDRPECTARCRRSRGHRTGRRDRRL